MTQGLPTIGQYVQSVEHNHDLFRKTGPFDFDRDIYGRVEFTAGNNAVVFRIKRENGRYYALKCPLKHNPHLPAKYDYFSHINDPIICPAAYCRDEAFVYDHFGSGRWYDLILMPWLDGKTLETMIRHAATEFGAPLFGQLAAGFDRLALELLSREWAHGDLKPENIIVRPDGSMILIDHDAAYIPDGKARGENFEVGTPGYQHPGRTAGNYDVHIDDYPAALISVSLHALALEPGLFRKYHRHGTIIIDPKDAIADTSQALARVKELFSLTNFNTLLARAAFLHHTDYCLPLLKDNLSAAACRE